MVRTLGSVKQAKMFGKRIKPYNIVQRTHIAKNSSVPASYSVAMTLANLLFPNNFPKIIATGLKDTNAQHSNTIYTKLVPLKKESLRGIESFYEERSKGNGFEAFHNDSDFSRYYKKYGSDIQKISDKISAKSGLQINDSTMNVGVRKGIKKNFVFFELDGVDLRKLGAFIQKLPASTPQQSLKKKQAVALFDFLLKQKQKGKLLNVHAQEKYVDRHYDFL